MLGDDSERSVGGRSTTTSGRTHRRVTYRSSRGEQELTLRSPMKAPKAKLTTLAAFKQQQHQQQPPSMIEDPATIAGSPSKPSAAMMMMMPSIDLASNNSNSNNNNLNNAYDYHNHRQYQQQQQQQYHSLLGIPEGGGGGGGGGAASAPPRHNNNNNNNGRGHRGGSRLRSWSWSSLLSVPSPNALLVLSAVLFLALAGIGVFLFFVSSSDYYRSGSYYSSLLFSNRDTERIRQQNEDLGYLLQNLQSKLDNDENNQLGSVMKDLEKKLEKAIADNNDMAQKLLQLEADRRRQQEEARQELQNAATAAGSKLRGGSANVDKLQHRVELLEKHRDILSNGVRIMCRKRLLEQFGGGPYRVEINLQFDPSDADRGGPATARIVLELASADDMPHSVYWFLTQVSLKLYDGCSFHRNAQHVVQAGPTADTTSSQRRRFIDQGYDHVLFQEYSDRMPHVKYSVGYAGRPSGPDFYINLRDNTVIHGPGGQDSLTDEADPCFANVVEGQDVVDRIHALNDKDGSIELVHSVRIPSMRIL